MACALNNLAIAVLHIYIILDGARSSSYFGAGEWMVKQAQQGSIIPALITWDVTAVLFCFALCSFVASEILSLPLPGLSYGLVTISMV